MGLSFYSFPADRVRTLTLSMISETPCSTPARRYERIARPNDITVTWYGAADGDQQVSSVKALGMGGLFLYGSRVEPIGTSLKLIFEVPGGLVFAADAVVRNIVPGEGMGVEFTKITSQDRDPLERLRERLLGLANSACPKTLPFPRP